MPTNPPPIQAVYPFDPTGAASTNLIQNEQQILTPPAASGNWSDYFFIVPLATPYFGSSLHMTLQPSGRTLVEGVDYLCTHRFYDASLQCASPVFGSVTFMDKTLAGVVTYSYQTLGGDWTLNSTQIATILANVALDPRITTFEEVANVPYQFPPVAHEWDVKDMVGASDVVNAIDQIAAAMKTSGDQGLANHLADMNNPHHVTAAQVGLGNVNNAGWATTASAQTGADGSSYMNPQLTAAAIATQALTPLAAHTARTDNPHNVSASQVGLGNVQNYTVASNADAAAGTAANRYMTPAATAAAIDALANAGLATHIGNLNNPHQVTATQVGLGDVPNYPMATLAEATTGTATNRFMSPALVAAVFQNIAGGSISAHIADHSNPHQVTKAQVGLGNVDNFATAANADGEAGSSASLFMTPAATAAAITAQALPPINAHVGRTDNPHAVTAAQVNLGSVSNYATAANADGVAGTSTSLFMTPAATTAAITAQALAPLNTHVGRTDNPHSVTKSQVNLGSVDNYATAASADVVTGTATNLFVTPAGVAAAIGSANAPLTAHLARTDNPHAVTATQVGLGLVPNSGWASSADAAAGLATTGFMNPALTASAVAALAGNGLAAHIARTDNPHSVTALQVGSYTTAQADAAIATAIATKLDKTAQAADSALLQGKNVNDIVSLAQNTFTGRINYYLPSYTTANAVAGQSVYSRLAILAPPTAITRTGQYASLQFSFIGGGSLMPIPAGGMTPVDDTPEYMVNVTLTPGLPVLRIEQRSGLPRGLDFLVDQDPTSLAYGVWVVADAIRAGATVTVLSDPGANWSAPSNDTNTLPATAVASTKYYSINDPDRQIADPAPGSVALTASSTATDLPSGYADSPSSRMASAALVQFLNVVGPSDTLATAQAIQMPLKTACRSMAELAYSPLGGTFGVDLITYASQAVWGWDGANDLGLKVTTNSTSKLLTKLSVEAYPKAAPVSLECAVSSVGTQDKAIGVCLAHEIVDGRHVGVWALRNPGGLDAKYGLFSVVINPFMNDEVILASTSTGLTYGDGVTAANRGSTGYVAGTGWSTLGVCKIAASCANPNDSTGNSKWTIQTSDFAKFDSTTAYQSTAALTVDIYRGVQLYCDAHGLGWNQMLRPRWGLAVYGQSAASFLLTKAPDLYARAYNYAPQPDGSDTSSIYYFCGDTAQAGTTSGWVSLPISTTADLILPRLIYSEWTSQFYIARQDNTLVPLPIVGISPADRQIITT